MQSLAVEVSSSFAVRLYVHYYSSVYKQQKALGRVRSNLYKTIARNYVKGLSCT
jgi:hypothetical protein